MLWCKCSLSGVLIAIATTVACLAGIVAWIEYGYEPGSEYACRMAESAEVNMEKAGTTTIPKTVFLVGYTGATGKALMNYLDENKTFSKVKLIGRKSVKLELKNADLFEQVVVDFDKLDEYRDAFKDASIGYCALGTTRAKSGYEGFIKVDHDYIVKVGELAKAAGCLHFNLVSSNGANKNSSFLYLRTKGQCEEALKVFHFDRFSIFRPSMLLAKRETTRLFERFVELALKPVIYMAPTAITIPVETVAKAIVLNSLATSEEALDVFENKAIHKLGGDTGDCKK